LLAIEEDDNLINTTKFVSLTGGLGNQLFQYAAALYESEKKNVVLVSSLGAPRNSFFGKPEIFSFKLEAIGFSTKASWLVKKGAGFSLRQGLYRTKIEEIKLVRTVMFRLGEALLSFHLRKRISLIICAGVGYSELPNPDRDQLLIGYFQSYRWASDPAVLEKLQRIELTGNSAKYMEYQDMAKAEKPLVVHIRLGDYKNETNFGILPESYYKKAIQQQLLSKKYSSIWLFSDELDDALQLIPKNLGIKIRLIEELDDSAAATLQVMRLGHGYVIANSTYSWWGAFLALRPDADVIAPSPWFRSIDEPVQLIPPHWTRCDAGWQ
jgi:hypothetical protein